MPKMMNSESSCDPVSMAFSSLSLGTVVTLPRLSSLIRTLTSYQWKSWAVGMHTYSRNSLDDLDLRAMALAMGLEICLITRKPNLASGNAPTAIESDERCPLGPSPTSCFCLLSVLLPVRPDDHSHHIRPQ